jgi:hypothetical protein
LENLMALLQVCWGSKSGVLVKIFRHFKLAAVLLPTKAEKSKLISKDWLMVNLVDDEFCTMEK